MAVTGGSLLLFHDTEIVSITKKDTTVVINFSPGLTSLPRLDAEAKKFSRYRILAVNIQYITTSSITQAGKVSFGVANGALDASSYDHDSIVKLRPSQSVASWKNSGISLGTNIMPALTLKCNDKTDDGTAFTFIYRSSSDNPGNFKFSYKIELSFPLP